jgi:hypothetical protein
MCSPKQVFVDLLRAAVNWLVPPISTGRPDWQERGASITVNGCEIGTTVAKSARGRDRLRGRDEAGG